MDPLRRRIALALAAAAALACAEWAGPWLGGPSLSVVPVFPAAIPGGGGGALLDDLDRVHVVVRQLPSRTLVADTGTGVDADGNAQLTVPVLIVTSTPILFEVLVEGIRSSDTKVLYSGIDTVAVRGGVPVPPVSLPVTYVGPCRLGSGCIVTVAPQDTTIGLGGWFGMRVRVDSAQTPVTGVPVALTNLTPNLVLVGPDGSVTALPSTSGGPASVVAAIHGAADTLRLTVSPLLGIPAAVVVAPGYGTLTTTSPTNVVQLAASVTDALGNPLAPSLVTWVSRAPGVASVSSGGLVTGVAPGSAILVASAAAGVADSLAVVVGDPKAPGNPIALALAGARSFAVSKVGQPVPIDVVVDLKAVPSELLGSYDARFTWNAGVLRFDSTQAGDFVLPLVIPDTAAAGILRFSAADALGRGGAPTLIRLWFTAVGPGTADDVLSLSKLTAAVTLTDLLPGLLVAPSNVTVAP